MRARPTGTICMSVRPPPTTVPGPICAMPGDPAGDRRAHQIAVGGVAVDVELGVGLGELRLNAGELLDDVDQLPAAGADSVHFGFGDRRGARGHVGAKLGGGALEREHRRLARIAAAIERANVAQLLLDQSELPDARFALGLGGRQPGVVDRAIGRKHRLPLDEQGLLRPHRRGGDRVSPSARRDRSGTAIAWRRRVRRSVALRVARKASRRACAWRSRAPERTPLRRTSGWPGRTSWPSRTSISETMPVPSGWMSKPASGHRHLSFGDRRARDRREQGEDEEQADENGAAAIRPVRIIGRASSSGRTSSLRMRRSTQRFGQGLAAAERKEIELHASTSSGSELRPSGPSPSSPCGKRRPRGPSSCSSPLQSRITRSTNWIGSSRWAMRMIVEPSRFSVASAAASAFSPSQSRWALGSSRTSSRG